MAMSDKDRTEAEAAAKRMATAEDGYCNTGLPRPRTDPAKRRFWQIHLSTAIIISFAASLLLWKNLQTYAYDPLSDFPVTIYCGWPWPALLRNNFFAVTARPAAIIGGIIANSFVALAILAGLCLNCEYFIRRREARKP